MELQWEYHYKDLKGSPLVKFDSNSIEIVPKDQSRVRVVPFDSLGEARVRRSLLSLPIHILFSFSTSSIRSCGQCMCSNCDRVSLSIRVNPASYLINKIIFRALARL